MIDKILRLIVVFFTMSACAESMLEDKHLSINLRLGFCEVLNSEKSLAKDGSYETSLFVRNVGGKFKAMGKLGLGYEYSSCYAVLIVESLSDKLLELPDIYGPEWSIKNTKSGARFPKSLPWFSSLPWERKHNSLKMKPMQAVCYLYGADHSLTNGAMDDLVVDCKSPEMHLASNQLGSPWHLGKIVPQSGLNLDMIGIGDVLDGRSWHGALLFPKCARYERALPICDNGFSEPSVILLLSNADKSDIKVKGFASPAWNLYVEIQGNRYPIAPSNFVARVYLDDFVIKSGHSKGLAIGVDYDMIVRRKEGDTMKFFASYDDGEINVDTSSGEVRVMRSE